MNTLLAIYKPLYKSFMFRVVVADLIRVRFVDIYMVSFKSNLGAKVQTIENIISLRTCDFQQATPTFLEPNEP